ncbi:MAG: pitrilysin family protein [Candidatus Pacearchaeota archaeon]
MKGNFERKVLENGMTILLEKRDIPVVSVAFAVRQGGVNEDSHEKGISHFIEHMLYKGTPSRDAKKIADEIEGKGGALNGFTDEEITAYWCKMPAEDLNIALEVLGDMVRNPKFDEKEVEKERKVIFEEIKRRKDNPQIYVFDKIQGLLYEAPLGEDLAGTYETMNSLGREELVNKFKEVYQTDKMVLCVVGNAEMQTLVDFVEKSFKKGNGKTQNFEIKKKNNSGLEKRKGIDQANLVLAFHAPLLGDDKNYAMKVLNSLIAEGMSSRLFTEIREKRNMAYSVRGYCNVSKDYSYELIYVGTTKEKVNEVKKLILEEFEKVSEGLMEEELEKTKEKMIGNYKLSMEDSQDQMVNILSAEIDGNAESFYEFEEKILKVKIEDVKELAKIKDYSFFALVPED